MIGINARMWTHASEAGNEKCNVGEESGRSLAESGRYGEFKYQGAVNTNMSPICICEINESTSELVCGIFTELLPGSSASV